MEEKGVLFTNWSATDFTQKWNSEDYTFPARSSRMIAEGTREHNLGLARFFAKHLADREMNKLNVPTDHFSRSEYTEKCFIPIEILKLREAEAQPALVREATNLNNDMAATIDTGAEANGGTEISVVTTPKKLKTPKPKKSDKEGFVS